MSIKMAAAKLSATAAGVALMTGGAVRVAEPMNTDDPQYTTNLDGKLVESAHEKAKYNKLTKVKYIKGRTRELPERRRRIVNRTIECEPLIPGM